MISSIRIVNFKLFTDVSVPLRPITVLTGQTGTGKSSLVQALLLTRSATEADGTVSLNDGEGLELGRFADIRNPEMSSHVSCEVHLSLDNNDIASWHFDADVDESLVMNIRQSPADAPSQVRRMTHLSAERVGPRDAVPLVSVPDDRLTVGSRGEHTAQVLATASRSKVRKAIRRPEAERLATLQLQVQSWLGALGFPLQVRAEALQEPNVAFLRFRSSDVTADWTRPANMGFGVTYSLPIIVAALQSRPGDLLVIENPEAHLHPSAQSAIASFLGRVAASGVQVLVESHSDHVVNGLRLACARSGHPLLAENTLFNFFNTGEDIVEVEAQTDGSVSEWPAGFFDQSSEDLAAILKARADGQ